MFKLPTGVTASGAGAVYEIRTDPLDEFTFNSLVAYSSTQITVLPQTNSANYSIRLDNSPVQVNKNIRFKCISGCQNLDITSSGWWNSTRGVVGQADATNYVANANRTINLTMETADTFSGQIQLPEGVVTAGTEQFTIEIKESSFAVTARFTETIQATPGASSIPFKIGVPAQETGGGWNMSLLCSGCADDLAAGPYFPRSAQGNPLALASIGQFFFLKNRDYANMQLDLISLRKPELSPAAAVGAISLLLLED